MRRSIHRLLAGLALVAGLAPATLDAQEPGDLVFTGRWPYAIRTAPATRLGNMTTLYDSGGYILGGLHMDPGNDAVLSVRHSLGWIRTEKGGRTTTLMTLPPAGRSVVDSARDQDGTIVIAQYFSSSVTAALLRLDPARTQVTTLTTVARADFTALARDGGTGDFLVIDGSNKVMRVDRETGAVRTLSTLAGAKGIYRALAYLPDRDLFAVAVDPWVSTTVGEIGLMNRAGTILAKIPLAAAEGHPNCLTFDERRSLVHCGTDNGHLITFSTTGKRIQTHDYGSGDIRSIDVWGDRRISIRTSGRPGKNVAIALAFTLSGGEPYGLAFSGGLRPGIRIGGQHLHVALDAIFFATVSRLPGFTGTLPANGKKTVNFRIPALPAGLRFYVTGFAQNAPLPGGFDLGNTECLRIE